MNMSRNYDVCVNGCVLPTYEITLPNTDPKPIEEVEHLPKMERLIDPIRCSTPLEATQVATSLMSYEALACYLSSEEDAETMIEYARGTTNPIGVVLEDSDLYIPDNITINGRKVFSY